MTRVLLISLLVVIHISACTTGSAGKDFEEVGILNSNNKFIINRNALRRSIELDGYIYATPFTLAIIRKHDGYIRGMGGFYIMREKNSTWRFPPTNKHNLCYVIIGGGQNIVKLRDMEDALDDHASDPYHFGGFRNVYQDKVYEIEIALRKYERESSEYAEGMYEKKLAELNLLEKTIPLSEARCK